MNEKGSEEEFEETLKLFAMVFKSKTLSREHSEGIMITEIGNQTIAGVFDYNIDSARKRLNEYIEKQEGIIQPIPIDEGEIESALWGLRCGKALMIDMQFTPGPKVITADDLKQIKIQLYEGIERKKRQIKRTEKLIEEIKKLEESENEDLIPHIIDEIIKLGIVWKPYPVIR